MMDSTKTAQLKQNDTLYIVNVHVKKYKNACNKIIIFILITLLWQYALNIYITL